MDDAIKKYKWKDQSVVWDWSGAPGEWDNENENYWNDSSVGSDIFEKETEKEDPWQVIDVNSIESQSVKADLGGAKTIPEGFTGRKRKDILPNTLPKETNSDHACSPEDIVIKMMLGLPYCLHKFCSKSEKLELLDQAIQLGDGSVILGVLVFLMSTLKESIFLYEVKRRPIAVDHYLLYIQSRRDQNKIYNSLERLGKSEDTGMLKYGITCRDTNSQTKLQSISKIYNSHFKLDPSLTTESMFLNEHILLLERQIPIEDIDSGVQSESKLILSSSPLLPTLGYVCENHWDKKGGHLACPRDFQKVFNITDKEFIYQALPALSKCEQWITIDSLLFTKSMLGPAKLRSTIPLIRVMKLLDYHNAPTTLRVKCLQLSDESMKQKLYIAAKYSCPRFIIESHFNSKNRGALEDCKNSLEIGSAEEVYATELLNKLTSAKR